jgi:SAM-dependent methyltransferase
VHRACPACDADNGAALASDYSPADWPLKHCRRCGFVYLEQAPDYATLLRDFPWKESLAEEKKKRRRDEPLLHKLQRPYKIFRTRLITRDKVRALCERYLAAGPVLDLGCGSGKRMVRLDPRFVPYGIEILPPQAERARQRFEPRGGAVLCQTALAGVAELPVNFFSGVLMISYLEHEIRPRAVLEGTRRILRPDGSLIVKVPNYACWNRSVRGRRWCGFRFPDHVNYFTPTSLVQLLEASGYRVVRFHRLDRLPTSDTMWLVAQPATGVIRQSSTLVAVPRT